MKFKTESPVGDVWSPGRKRESEASRQRLSEDSDPGCQAVITWTVDMGEPRALALSMKGLLFGGNQESGEARVTSHFPALSTLTCSWTP